MRQKNKRNLVIVILVVAILFIGVGYAALQQTLTINGTAGIGDTNWDVKITGIEEGTLIGATTQGDLTFTDTSATFSVNLDYPGATATYSVTIANEGTIDAVLESITGVDEANAADPAEITYEVVGVTPGTTTLAAKNGSTVSTNVAKVIVTWNESDEDAGDEIPTTTSKTATIKLNYKQDTN